MQSLCLIWFVLLFLLKGTSGKILAMPMECFFRVWSRPRLCANPALQFKLSLKKTAKGTICPLQNLEKKAGKAAHTKRFISVQKLQAKTEHGKFQSRSTEHVRLMLNQAWWTRLAIVNMSHRKRVRTLGSFFTPNQSQSESEKNDTEEEQCIN